MKGFKIKYWIVPIVLLVGLTIAFRSGMFAGEKAYSQTADNKVNIKVVAVQYSNKVPKLALNGSIEAQTSATISSKISGTIQQILVEEGQYVRAGEPLIKLDSIELANSARMAQESVRKAQVNYNLAKTDYQQYKTLYEQDAVSKDQLESAEAKLQIAQADLSSARASQSSAQQQYGYGVVTAPVSGVVANKTATVGQVVSPGMSLLLVQNINQVYAVVNIEQGDLGLVKIGQKAEVTVDAYSEEVFAGTIELINPQAGASNRMFRTKVKIDNPGEKLKPGMFAQVQLATGEAVKVLTVPQTAVLETKGIYYVFTVENNRAVRHQVEIGSIAGNAIEIKSGLQAGDQVVVTSVNQLKDGEAVQVIR